MLMRYFYSIQMDKAYKQQIEPYFADKIFRLHVSRSRWDVILQQRHLQVFTPFCSHCFVHIIYNYDYIFMFGFHGFSCWAAQLI
jgi:hypothetical protein